MRREFQLQVNGQVVVLTSDEDRPLLDVLREDIGLTGTKYGCGEGECGACTVLIDGRAERSCITRIADVGDQAVTTIEGLTRDGQLHAVQQAFLDQQAMQCGYCVPGQIMTAVSLLRENPAPSREQIVAAMTGNLCRCCNYPRLLAAVEQAAAPR